MVTTTASADAIRIFTEAQAQALSAIKAADDIEEKGVVLAVQLLENLLTVIKPTLKLVDKTLDIPMSGNSGREVLYQVRGVFLDHEGIVLPREGDLLWRNETGLYTRMIVAGGVWSQFRGQLAYHYYHHLSEDLDPLEFITTILSICEELQGIFLEAMRKNEDRHQKMEELVKRIGASLEAFQGGKVPTSPA